MNESSKNQQPNCRWTRAFSPNGSDGKTDQDGTPFPCMDGRRETFVVLLLRDYLFPFVSFLIHAQSKKPTRTEFAVQTITQNHPKTGTKNQDP